MRYFYQPCFALTMCLSAVSYANPTFLPAEQAFQFSAESLSTQKAQLHWQIAPHYYLYHDQFKVTAQSGQTHATIELNLAKGHEKDDPTFGRTEVHYVQVKAQFNVQPNTEYKVLWQGCSQDGLCYPLQSTLLQTDSDGLLPQQIKSSNDPLSQTLSNTSSQNNLKIATNADETALTDIDPVASHVIPTQDQSNTVLINAQNNDKSSTTSLQWNDDQSFFKLLSQDSLFFNLLIFFGLGILLAFLPCSLPLIPIISTLIIQRKTGYKALLIVSSFILSMALVYGLMGIFVAEIGYSFQRWFQHPLIISLFAILFIVFALNLFGLFQFSLPQSWLNKLNQFQDKQKAGTLLGSISMGALSALIVGPCMSAPLAGALLFVSQSHNAVLGGLYLFILGLGIGLPLFIVSLFGTRLLPKPGLWMNHLKSCFGFMMLLMAIYFIRPMLSSPIYLSLIALICFGMTTYLIKVLKDNTLHLFSKILMIVAILALLTIGVWNVQQAIKANQVEHSQSNTLNWHTVSTQNQLETAFSEAKSQNKAVIVDVYADWCVACQPLEKEVFPRSDVQTGLADYYLIRLDLSKYNASQDVVLKQHEILGPPTLLIFNQNGSEIRALRLTGTFSAEQLLNQLKKINQYPN